MYVGDDVADGDAFKKLAGLALTVRVGESKTSYAAYYMQNQTEMSTLLNQILTIKTS